MFEIEQTGAFEAWFGRLRDTRGRARIEARLSVIAQTGHFGDVRPVGSNVFELRFHFGPGYRVYYTMRGEPAGSASGRGRQGLAGAGHQERHRIGRGALSMTDKAKTRPFRFGETVKTAEDARTYIDAALEEVGPEHLKAVLRGIAESEGMTALAERAGITRAGLYRALSDEGDPKLSTLTAVLDALGLRLTIVPKEAV